MHGLYNVKIMVLGLNVSFYCFNNTENYDKIRNKIAHLVVMTENNL